MVHFVDRTLVHVRGGNGGNGCVSVHREKFKPLGGPDGGNGGSGGSVIAMVSDQTTTLLEYHYHPHQRAGNGGVGKGGVRHGKSVDDLVLPVPQGTVVKSADSSVVLADLVEPGQQYLIAGGGQGGAGNAALASKRRKAPGFALLGLEGEERDVVFELKTIADVALIGFPSAGKSSLIAAVSAARPKIADYPFTTLVPNLGVVESGQTRFTVADVPGLVPGASGGKGLGLEFLRHVERCAVLVHVIDCATMEQGRDPLSDLKVIEAELEHYERNNQLSHGRQDSQAENFGQAAGLPLMKRRRLVVLNKIDVPQARKLAASIRADVEAMGWPVFEVSAVSHEGLKKLCFAMAHHVEQSRQQLRLQEEQRLPIIRPVTLSRKNSKGFVLTTHVRFIAGLKEKYYRIVGSKPERWVKQTDFNNDEAVGYLADRFAKLGVEKELFEAGARPGATVVIGVDEGVVFEWEPTMVSGAELLSSPRGTDARLEDIIRPTRAEKKQARQTDFKSENNTVVDGNDTFE